MQIVAFLIVVAYQLLEGSKCIQPLPSVKYDFLSSIRLARVSYHHLLYKTERFGVGDGRRVKRI